MKNRIKLLIVDDDEVILEMLYNILLEYGYFITIVESGFKAIEIIKRIFYDIVLLDIEMPGLNGVEVFRKIKEISPLTTVIMMTGADVDELVEKALNEGAFGIVYKPFSKNLLLKLLYQAVQQIKILFISDKEKIDSFLSEIKKLNLKNYNFFPVEDIPTAVEVTKDNKFSVAILYLDSIDENMFNNIENLRSNNPQMMIILLVDSISEEYVNLALHKGVSLILKIPFDMKSILEKIDNFVHEKKKNSVLLVEDDESMISMLSFVLENEGYKVSVAYTGAESIRKVKTQYFDIIIIDYKLPDISGIEVIKKIKQVQPDVSIIFITAYPDLQNVIEALREQVVDYIIKPTVPEEILNSIRKAVLKKSLQSV